MPFGMASSEILYYAIIQVFVLFKSPYQFYLRGVSLSYVTLIMFLRRLLFFRLYLKDAKEGGKTQPRKQFTTLSVAFPNPKSDQNFS